MICRVCFKIHQKKENKVGGNGKEENKTEKILIHVQPGDKYVAVSLLLDTSEIFTL